MTEQDWIKLVLNAYQEGFQDGVSGCKDINAVQEKLGREPNWNRHEKYLWEPTSTYVECRVTLSDMFEASKTRAKLAEIKKPIER